VLNHTKECDLRGVAFAAAQQRALAKKNQVCVNCGCKNAAFSQTTLDSVCKPCLREDTLRSGMFSETLLSDVYRRPSFLRYGLSLAEVRLVGNSLKRLLGKGKDVYVPRYILYAEAVKRGKDLRGVYKRLKAFETKRFVRRDKIQKKLCNKNLVESMMGIRTHYLIEIFENKESTVDEEEELDRTLL
jgi:hypothetical protein